MRLLMPAVGSLTASRSLTVHRQAGGRRGGTDGKRRRAVRAVRPRVAARQAAARRDPDGGSCATSGVSRAWAGRFASRARTATSCAAAPAAGLRVAPGRRLPAVQKHGSRYSKEPACRQAAPRAGAARAHRPRMRSGRRARHSTGCDGEWGGRVDRMGRACSRRARSDRCPRRPGRRRARARTRRRLRHPDRAAGLGACGRTRAGSSGGGGRRAIRPPSRSTTCRQPGEVTYDT